MSPALIALSAPEQIDARPVYYCGGAEKGQTALRSVLIGNWFSKYDVEVRFCFLDSDRDGRFDKVALGGKRSADEHVAASIEPVPYHLVERVYADDELIVRYRRFIASTPRIELIVDIKTRGGEARFDRLIMPRGGRDDRHSRIFSIDLSGKSHSGRTTILGAEIEARLAGREVSFTVKRNFRKAYFGGEVEGTGHYNRYGYW